MRKELIVLLITGLSLVLIGCKQETSEAVTQEVTTMEATVSEESYTPQTREFTIRVLDSGFDPSTVKVREGDTVKLEVINELEEDVLFEVVELGVDTRVASGTASLVELKASKKGSFEFGDPSKAKAKGMLVVQ